MGAPGAGLARCQQIVSRGGSGSTSGGWSAAVAGLHAEGEELSALEFARRRLVGLVRRLGFATERELRERLTIVSPDEFAAALRELATESTLRSVRVTLDDGNQIEAFAMSKAAADDQGHARTTLLSPFDPLIKDRDRTERLFGFRYRLEMYVPRAQREFGFFVLPILHAGRLIGRIDPAMDRKASRFTVRAIRLESGAPPGASTIKAVTSAVRDLADFLGADTVQVDSMPDAWDALPSGAARG
jgi:uncharacterized protein